MPNPDSPYAARQQGHAAYLAGKPICLNPHVTAFADEWRRGWREAQLEAGGRDINPDEYFRTHPIGGDSPAHVAIRTKSAQGAGRAWRRYPKAMAAR